MIRNDGDGMRSMFMAVSSESSIPLGQARLVFNRYGDQYFLHQIWTTGVYYYELPKSRTERWIEKDLSLGDLKRIEMVPIVSGPQ